MRALTCLTSFFLFIHNRWRASVIPFVTTVLCHYKLYSMVTENIRLLLLLLLLIEGVYLPLSRSVHCNFVVRDGNVLKGSGRAPPPPPPARADFSTMME
jgi:hypothetical protein